MRHHFGSFESSTSCDLLCRLGCEAVIVIVLTDCPAFFVVIVTIILVPMMMMVVMMRMLPLPLLAFLFVSTLLVLVLAIIAAGIAVIFVARIRTVGRAARRRGRDLPAAVLPVGWTIASRWVWRLERTRDGPGLERRLTFLEFLVLHWG